MVYYFYYLSLAIPISWIIFGYFILKRVQVLLEYPLICKRIEEQGTMQEEWIPFVRKCDESNALSPSYLFAASMTLAPMRLISAVLLLIICGLGTVTLNQAGVRAMTRWGSRTILGVFGIRVRNIGTRVPTQEASCIVSNHVSILDILVLLSMNCCFVAKDEIKKLWVIGRVAELIGCIFVCRDSPASRATAKQLIKDTLLYNSSCSVGSQAQLVIFPEGTTTNGYGLIQFRRGAFESGVTIQPVRLEYSNLECSMALLNTLDLILLISVLNSSEITVHFLSPIQSSLDTEAAETMASYCRSLIASTKNVYNRIENLKLYDYGSHRAHNILEKMIVDRLKANSIVSSLKSSAVLPISDVDKN